MKRSLQQLIEFKGSTVQAVAKKMRLSHGAVYHWCQGLRMPPNSRMLALAQAINCREKTVINAAEESCRLRKALKVTVLAPS